MDSSPESTNETAASGNLPATSRDSIYTAGLPFLLEKRAKFVKSLNHYTAFCSDIHRILDNLCERDNGFLFIKAAVNEFLHGHLGVNDRLGPELKTIDAAIALATTGNDKIGLQFILEFVNLRRLDREDKYHLVLAHYEITNVLIYEILSIFDVDLSVEQIRRLELYSISSYLELLHELHEKSKAWEPRSIHHTLPESDIQNPASKTIKEFKYHINLDQNADQVRVIELLPGSQDDPIKCELKSSNIHDIRTALSYVWGTETSSKDILVDQQSFSVTKNLYEILNTLRLPTVSRTIWVDAICINQSNVDERTHQVRLMGDIYSKANPVCEWNMKQYVLYLMLLCCTSEILSHEWWTRVWTLQEGALPSRSPMFFFRDHEFSFDDISAAIQVLTKISNASQETQMRMYYARLTLNSNTKGNRKGNKKVGLISNNSEGLKPYYSEHYHIAFKRATAQCNNMHQSLFLANKFPLLLESQTVDKDKPPSTSWVLDFRFCDTLYFTNRDATTVTTKVTLNGFICERADTRLKFLEEYRDKNPMYTTPKLYFAPGFQLIAFTRLGQSQGYRMTMMKDPLEPMSDSSNDSFGFDDWGSTLNFFLLQHEYSVPDETFGQNGNFLDENFDKFLNTRYEELEGKTYFITAKGLLGIATAPVQKGDSLNLLHDAGVYFILRDVQDQGDAKGEQKHRIIARAVIHDEDINYPEWIKSFPRLSFQII
ncbi:hypothetical protein NPX13_g3331 [Xylaria arbuscula]|uniref:Heterokaryon incompatibility domain-containing protein n=1 Tax=Xylaria arbuscula TaxID=114810 RepID=A0A9W8NIG5_9PEZI|nr:hypothetical protein NPX13_g3331 [Xylaria arbuscula]